MAVLMAATQQNIEETGLIVMIKTREYQLSDQVKTFGVCSGFCPHVIVVLAGAETRDSKNSSDSEMRQSPLKSDLKKIFLSRPAGGAASTVYGPSQCICN